MKKTRTYFSDLQEEASPNLTPLIDVVFVVLIMFIIIAPMLEIDKIQLAAAAKQTNIEAKSVQQASSISIYVKEDNTIWINAAKVSAVDLTAILKKAKAKNPKAIPQLFHDKRAQFGIYQQVKNAVESSGFEELDVILTPG
jgi:biopolymer transport protein ExbD